MSWGGVNYEGAVRLGYRRLRRPPNLIVTGATHQHWSAARAYCVIIILYRGGGPAAMVKALSAWKVEIAGSFPLYHTSFKETKKFLLCSLVNIFSIVGNLRRRDLCCARPQTTRARILNPASGGQCHLIILRRFSWPV